MRTKKLKSLFIILLISSHALSAQESVDKMLETSILSTEQKPMETLKNRKGNGGDLSSLEKANRNMTLKKKIANAFKSVKEEIFGCVTNHFPMGTIRANKILDLVLAAHNTITAKKEGKLFVFNKEQNKEVQVPAKNLSNEEPFTNYFKKTHINSLIQIDYDFLFQQLELASELTEEMRLKSLIFHELASIAKLEGSQSYNRTVHYINYLKAKEENFKNTYLSKNGLSLHLYDIVRYKTKTYNEIQEIIEFFDNDDIVLDSDGAHRGRLVGSKDVFKMVNCLPNDKGYQFPFISGQRIGAKFSDHNLGFVHDRGTIIYMDDSQKILTVKDDEALDSYSYFSIEYAFNLLPNFFHMFAYPKAYEKEKKIKINIYSPKDSFIGYKDELKYIMEWSF